MKGRTTNRCRALPARFLAAVTAAMVVAATAQPTDGAARPATVQSTDGAERAASAQANDDTAGRAAAAQSTTEAAWRAARDGGIVLLRHATAPGTGDPPGFVLGDCSTQRNLDEDGREEARRIGGAFRAHGARIGAVWTSRWCRTRETAALAFDVVARDEPAFDSFYERAAEAPARTAAARAALAEWRGPGTLVVVTHQVDITALTGIVPDAGEAVVVRRDGGELRVVGRLRTMR